jgi:hypothetical protein
MNASAQTLTAFAEKKSNLNSFWPLDWSKKGTDWTGRNFMGSSPLLPSLGSYFTPGDKFRHAIVATVDGDIHELFYNPKTSTGDPDASAGDATLGSFCGLEFVTGFYAGDDELQHPVVVTSAGDIFGISYKPDKFAMAGPLANMQDMVTFSGFYAGDTHLRTLIAGTGESIQEITFDSKNKISYARTLPGLFPGLTHVSGFYCDDDHSRHVIVSNSRGDITDLRYASGANAQPVSVPLGQFEGVISITGFYAANDKTRVVIVASAEGDLFEITYTQHEAPQVGQKPFENIPNLRAISGFYTPDDKKRHVIVVDSTGNVIEVWYENVANGVFVTEPPLGSFGMPTPQVEYVGPEITNLNKTALAESNITSSSPAGRCIALAGSPSKLYTLSDTGGVWSSINGGAWSLEPGSPAPSLSDKSSVSVLVVSPINENRVLAANATGLWETTDGGASWSFLQDPSEIGATSKAVNGVVFDDSGRVFVALSGGVGIQQAQNDVFTFENLNDTITAVVVSESKVWARSATSVYVSPAGGANWSAANAIDVPDVTFKVKDQFILAATDDFAYLIGGTPGDVKANPKGGCPENSGCAMNNVLVIFNAKTQAWTTQVVTSTDKKAWQKSKKAKGPEANTCDGSSSDAEVTGQRFLRVIQLQEPTLENGIGEGVQLIFGAGQEVWRAIGQNDDGTITDWNWAVGTVGPCFSDRDPVHADIWDFLLDTSEGGRTAWLACDGGVYTTTVAEVNYEFSKAKWKPVIEGLHTHQIQSMTVLRVNQISEPRIVYAIGDNSAFFRDTSATTLPFQQWQSYSDFGDGNFTAGDSSAPTFSWLARQLDTEAFLKFGSNPKSASTPKSAWLINSKTGTFVDPSVPTRFRFVPSPVDEGQYTSADAVMMVDLPLVDKKGNPFQQQPGPSSNGLPVLIRNKTYDKNPDINQSSAKGKGWVLERGTLPAGCVGFAVSEDRQTQPVYYAFTDTTLFAERQGAWSSIATNLISSRTFGPVFPNPYDSNVVYVLTTDKGVQVSNQAGDNFQPDAQLNTLLDSKPGDVNQIAFNYDSPASVVVGTESGKLFFSSGGGVWKDLTSFLPTVPIPIRSVAIDCEAIYVGTFGRGVLRVRRYSMS